MPDAPTTDPQSPEGALTLLLVEKDDHVAAGLEAAFRDTGAGILLRRVAGRDDFAETLADGRIDGVLVGDDPSAIRLLVEELAGASVPVIVRISAGRRDRAEELLEAGGDACVFDGDGPDGLVHLPARVLGSFMHLWQERALDASTRRRERERMLGTIRQAISRVNHEINNPLSIISGNAQLLLELVHAMDLSDEFMQPIQDIDEASHRIVALLTHLVQLKQSIPPYPVEE